MRAKSKTENNAVEVSSASRLSQRAWEGRNGALGSGAFNPPDARPASRLRRHVTSPLIRGLEQWSRARAFR